MFETKTNHRVSPRVATFGMWLFLASLTMLFGATILGYLIIRLHGANSPARGQIHLPELLWLSTAIILIGSYVIHMAVDSVRREHQRNLQRLLLVCCVLAIAFVCVQTPSLIQLLAEHRRFASHGLALYGLVFFLILIHALHVLGGIVGLTVTTIHASQHRYDHENYAGVKHAAMYWHFLDLIWLIMFFSLFLTA
jgi:heme/copper-type cytochrome/quinol oxidase subunit 3